MCLSKQTNNEVFLDLFIKLIESFLSLLHGGAGLMVALSPLLQVALLQVLVGQNQGTEAVACILLVWLDYYKHLKTQIFTK